MTLSAPRDTRTSPSGGDLPWARDRRPPVRPARVVLHLFLIATSLVWLAPVLWAVYSSLRPYSDSAKYGYVSLAHSLSFQNYKQAWVQSGMAHFFWNSVLITVPALALALLFASFVGFVVTRYSWWFNLPLLMLFTAGNLLPAQVIITPLYRLYLSTPLPAWMSDSGSLFNSYWGIILIHVAFQGGFCVFVLSNYMRTLPKELFEAADVDGASAWRQYWQISLPLCRPPLAALATLEFTWIYNDFFWAFVLIQTGDKRPITSALNNLKGAFFVDNNMVAAGALIAAAPTLLVFFILQKQFIGGLTMGASK